MKISSSTAHQRESPSSPKSENLGRFHFSPKWPLSSRSDSQDPISSLCLEGAWHRDDQAVPWPRRESRPEWCWPRNTIFTRCPHPSTITQMTAHEWGVGPHGKASWAAPPIPQLSEPFINNLLIKINPDPSSEPQRRLAPNMKQMEENNPEESFPLAWGPIGSLSPSGVSSSSMCVPLLSSPSGPHGPGSLGKDLRVNSY